MPQTAEDGTTIYYSLGETLIKMMAVVTLAAVAGAATVCYSCEEKEKTNQCNHQSTN